MRFIFSCLLSLSAHLALLLALTWLSHTPAPLPLNMPIKATLRHASVALNTLGDTKTSAPQTPETPRDTQSVSTAPAAGTKPAPKNLHGPALRRAQAMLSKHLFYPPLAVTQGLEGEVVLLLTLDAAGQIRALAIAKSSGHVLLDDAALDAVRHVGALPDNPHQTLLPVTFRLQ
ncbi:MAG: energy transducer TonB [Rugosibacter sp.]|jgi:protein TonB|nr:energy transducer TonB [Rugosibacter sp.]